MFMAAFTSIATAANDKVVMKLKLEKGKAYRQDIVINQKLKQNIMGQERTTDMNMVFGYIMSVKDIKSNGDNIIDATYDKVIYDMGAGMSYSSDKNDTDNIFGKMMSVMKGFTFHMVMAPDGVVKEVSGIDKMVDKMMEKAAANMPGSQVGIMREAMSKSLSNESVKNMTSQTTNFYPDHAVGIGDSWTKEIEMQSMVKMKATHTYTVRDIKDGVVLLDMTSKIHSIRNEVSESSSQISGVESGTMQVSRKTGLLLVSDMEQSLSGSISVSNPNGGDPIDVPVSIKSVINMTTK